MNVGNAPVELIAVGTLPLFGDGQPAFPSLPGGQKPLRTRAARKTAEPPPAEEPSARKTERPKRAPAARTIATSGAPRRGVKMTAR